MTDKLWKAVAGAALVLSAIAVYMAMPSMPSFGAIGVKLVENYSPYVRYNGGTYTALPIYTTSSLKADGGLTVTTTNAATSTTSVGCVQTTATSTATPIRFLYNTQATTTISGTGSGVVVWGYGTCPF